MILTAESPPDQILDFREFISNFVNTNLEKKDNWNAEKLAIRCLALFCEDIKTDTNISSPPIILDILSSTAVMRLTELRHKWGAPFEMVYNIIQAYSKITVSALSLNYLSENSLELYTRLCEGK